MSRSIKLIKAGIVLIPFFFNLHGEVYSQDYAGTDRHICAGSNAQIGAEGIPGACYAWSPETGLSNPQSPNPIADPLVTTTYTVKVVGENFTFTATDVVTVFVESEISAISATPVKCCWKTGENITPEQFVITTTPPGMEGYLSNITINPATVPLIAGSVANVEVTISAVANCGGTINSLSTTTEIAAVEESYESTATIGFSEIDYDGLIEACDFLLGALSKLPGPCSSSLGGDALSIEGSSTDFTLCCPEPVCIKDGKKYSGSLIYNPDISCDFPFAGVPYLASVNIYLTAGVSATFSVDGIVTTCTGHKMCVSISASVSGGGGVSLTVLGGNALSASLALILTLEAPVVEYCYPANTWDIMGQPCVQVDLVGEVTLFTFVNVGVSCTILPQQCF